MVGRQESLYVEAPIQQHAQVAYPLRPQFVRKKQMTDLLTVMQPLHRSGITLGIEAATGRSSYVWLGDATNGYDSAKSFCPEHLSEAVTGLRLEACRIHHTSEHARHQDDVGMHYCYWGRPVAECNGDATVGITERWRPATSQTPVPKSPYSILRRRQRTHAAEIAL